jgi:hypothetical protein
MGEVREFRLTRDVDNTDVRDEARFTVIMQQLVAELRLATVRDVGALQIIEWSPLRCAVAATRLTTTFTWTWSVLVVSPLTIQTPTSTEALVHPWE